MIPAPLPENEEQRLNKLYELDVMDTLEEQAYDDITHLAAQICDVPIALISLIDRDRQFLKSHYGLEANEISRELGFCPHAILTGDVMVVEDAAKDERFHDNPLVTGGPEVRFYAGAPLIMEGDLKVGTLCVVSNQPRTITPDQTRTLEVLARQVVSQLELRQSEANLKSSVSQLRATLEATADGILVVDRKGDIKTYNKRFLELWNLPDEVVTSNDGPRAVEFVLSQLADPQVFIERIEQLYSEPELTSFDVLEFKDGRTYERYSHPQKIDDKIKGRVWSFRDVTEMKASNEALSKAKTEAEQASMAKSEFLSSMSHELRTPMNSILGFAQILTLQANDPLSSKQRSCVDQILRGGTHLLELIDQVLELNKIEAGKFPLNIDHMPVRSILDESLGLVMARAEKEGVEIRDLSVESDLPFLWTDRTRLTQALLNLLSNAIKYNREGGTVTIRCTELPEKMLRISVADNGLGIPAERQEHLFKPFERLGRETGMIEGTGIGLTITKQIVELLGGQVGYESEEGKGSEFWVEIPISSKHLGEQKQPVADDNVVRLKDPEHSPGRVRTVLYIEDNPANMNLMEAVVGNIPNARLLTAYNAELGIEQAKLESPELILMDVNLPGMSGTEALKQLQNMQETKDIPVIAITAAAMSKDVEAGLKAGFKDYITKPINVPSLVQIIEAVLEGLKKPGLR